MKKNLNEQELVSISGGTMNVLVEVKNPHTGIVKLCHTEGPTSEKILRAITTYVPTLNDFIDQQLSSHAPQKDVKFNDSVTASVCPRFGTATITLHNVILVETSSGKSLSHEYL